MLRTAQPPSPPALKWDARQRVPTMNVCGEGAANGRRGRLRSRFLIALGCALASSLFAAEPQIPAPDPAAHTVIVPYDGKKPAPNQKPSRYYLDRATFERLWSLAKENRKPELPENAGDKPAASVSSAMYRGTIEETRLVIEAKLEIASRGRWAKISLPFSTAKGDSLTVRDWMLDGKPASIGTDNGLILESPGRHTVQAVIEMPRTAGWKSASLSLPRSPAAMLSLAAPATDGRPVFSADLVTENSEGGQRVFTAALSAGDALNITRSPKRPPADDALPAVADSRLIIGHSQGRAQSLLGEARFGFPGTERSRFALAADADWRIDGWTVQQGGRSIGVRSWSLRDEGGRRLIEIELDAPVADWAEVSLWGSRPSAEGQARSAFFEPRAKKGEQTVALVHDETLTINPQPAAAQRRIDKPDTLNPSLFGARGKMSALYHRLPAGQTLAYTLAAAPAKREAGADYVFQLSEQKQEMMAALVLKRGLDAWSQMRIGLPADFEIQSVAGPSLAAWKQEGGDVFLQFLAGSSGAEARLVIYLAKSPPQPQARWQIAPLKLEGFEKISGSALIVAHAATEAKLESLAASHDFSEADPAGIKSAFAIAPPQQAKRALKFERGAWTADVSLAKQPARFSADGVALAQATDAGLLLSQQVGFYVEQGALSRVTVRLPAALPEATVKGDALREVQTKVSGAVREYDCSFQSEVLAQTALTFDMVLPLAGELSLPFVEVAGAERLRRFFVLDNSSSRESKVLAESGVELCAKEALPYVPQVLSQPAFYRSRGAAGELRAGYQQLQATEGNAAIVALADITSVWRADGERWDTIVYSIFNRSLQFLPVILPDQAELIAATVSGEAVRADEQVRADGKRIRLIPLIQTRAGQRSLEVKLICRIPGTEKRLPLKIRMDDPELVGISAERTVWTAIVPKKYKIADTDGNMEEVAEEGKALEKLQGWISDLGRINRALSSKDYYSREEGEFALKEAEKLAMQIEDESRKVEGDNKSKLSYFRLSKKEKKADFGDDDGDKEAALQSKAMEDLGEVRKDLEKQREFIDLNEAAVKAASSEMAGKQQLSIGNTWSFNNASGQTVNSEFDGFINFGGAVQGSTASGRLGEPSQIVLNDNLVVQNAFFEQPVAKIQREIDMRLAGTGDIVKTGSGGILVLSGSSTYTGGVTLNSGSLMVANNDTVSTATGFTAGGILAGSGAVTLNRSLEETVRQAGKESLGLAIDDMSALAKQPAQGFARSQMSQLGSNARANTFTGGTVVAGGELALMGDVPVAGRILDSRGSAGGAWASQPGATRVLPSDGRRAGFQMFEPNSIDGHVRADDDAARKRMQALGQPLNGMNRSFSLGAPLVSPFANAPAAGGGGFGRSTSERLTIADPFAAAPPTPAAPMPALAQAPPPAPADLRLAEPRAEAAKPAGAAGAFDTPQIAQQFGIEAQVASQLRATGRRSLMIEVPSDGTAFHYRKLKDHAVLELQLREGWSEEKKWNAIWLAAGLAVWAALSALAGRRREAGGNTQS